MSGRKAIQSMMKMLGLTHPGVNKTVQGQYTPVIHPCSKCDLYCSEELCPIQIQHEDMRVFYSNTRLRTVMQQTYCESNLAGITSGMILKYPLGSEYSVKKFLKIFASARIDISEYDVIHVLFSSSFHEKFYSFHCEPSINSEVEVQEINSEVEVQEIFIEEPWTKLEAFAISAWLGVMNVDHDIYQRRRLIREYRDGHWTFTLLK